MGISNGTGTPSIRNQCFGQFLLLVPGVAARAFSQRQLVLPLLDHAGVGRCGDDLVQGAAIYYKAVCSQAVVFQIQGEGIAAGVELDVRPLDAFIVLIYQNPCLRVGEGRPVEDYRIVDRAYPQRCSRWLFGR